MLNSFGIIEAVGLFGGFILLLAYFLLQAGRLRGSDNRYALLVMAGNTLLLLSVFKTLVPGAAMVQATFVMISVYGITRRAVKARELRFKPMERALMARVLPDMPPVHARRLLDLGEWSLASPGSRLTEEGEPVRNLIYLDTAAATVTVGGMVVARLESALVGDINAVAGGAGLGHGRGRSAGLDLRGLGQGAGGTDGPRQRVPDLRGTCAEP